MSRAKILVVDDDAKLTRLIKAILEGTDLYEVQEETRPSAALAAAQRFRPDLILLDLNMPGKDGGEVAQELQADAVLCRTPLLFLTWLLSPAETGGRETRISGRLFLAKPVDSEVLISTIGAMLRRENPRLVAARAR